MITHPFFEAIDISISEDACNILNQQWGFPELDELIGTREMAVCHPKMMGQLRNTLQAICTTVSDNPDLLKRNINLQNLIKYEVPHLLMQALMTAETQAIKTAPAKRSHALKTAVDHIQTTPLDEISLNKFCSNNDINKRTLQRAFIEQYGTSPNSYAKAHRLNSVYKELSPQPFRLIGFTDDDPQKIEESLRQSRDILEKKVTTLFNSGLLHGAQQVEGAVEIVFIIAFRALHGLADFNIG